MYRIYRKIPDSFQGDFDFLSKSGTFLRNFYQFYGSFPGVSLMMREVSHVCPLTYPSSMHLDPVPLTFILRSIDFVNFYVEVWFSLHQ